ncbi:lactose operon repressor [Escherichia coli TA206]|uniref:LacI family DNA-binding transcriptional regulator n=1 Tax=Escherichia coli TaxID=562 RepID=UPI0001E8A74C|nr:LacI family DNA-binding transcriptional regulator [Escherichia coli]EGI25774.1 lactose operon repressor [Escherichia coli TA206]
MKKNVTLYDVAVLAKVSGQTVSRVLNTPDKVSERTRDRVFSAMKTLRYVPNRPAQLLAGKISSTIGIITASLVFHAPSQIIASIQNHAAKNGFQTSIIMPEKQDYNALQHALNELQAQNIKGVIINLPVESEVAERLVIENINVSCVFLDVSVETDVSMICFDYKEGCSKCVRHLWSLGHRHFGLLAGPQDSISARLRLNIWRNTLHQLGCTDAVTVFGDWGSDSGWSKTIELFRLKPDISAIVVGNDQMALGVLSALKYLNKTGGNSVSVTGYDDTEGSQYFSPSLTTVRHDFNLLGMRAVEVLLDKIKTPDRKFFELLPVEMVIRNSTGKYNNKQDISIMKIRRVLQQALDELGHC